MPDRKCSDQYQQFFPIAKTIAQTKCGYEKYMIVPAKIGDMFPAKVEVEPEFLHKLQPPVNNGRLVFNGLIYFVWKINKRFVTQKSNFLMAASFYKWFGVICLNMFLFSSGGWNIPGTAPATGKPEIHPFYVSVTEMEYNATDKTLEIACKVFTDDFEKAMTKSNNTKVDLYKPKDSALIQKQVADYLRNHFQLKVDGKPVALEYIGHEIEEQSTWSYFQVNKLNTAPHKVEITSNVFFEMYDKQINIFHVTVNGTRKSTKLDYPATNAVFEF